MLYKRLSLCKFHHSEDTERLLHYLSMISDLLSVNNWRGTILRIAGKRAQAEYNGKCCSDWLCELREEDVVYIPTLMVLLTLRQCQLTSQSYEQLITIVYWQSGNCKHGSTVSFEACIINFAHKCSVMFYWQAGTELSLDFGYSF